MTDLLALARSVHANNLAKGFWDGVDMNDHAQLAVKVALIASEVFELLEELRYPEPRVGKTGYPAEIEEWADVIIRALDYAEARGWTQQGLECVQVKATFNTTRSVRHGGKKF